MKRWRNTFLRHARNEFLMCCLILFLGVYNAYAQSIDFGEDEEPNNFTELTDIMDINNQGVKLLEQKAYRDAIALFQYAVQRDNTNEICMRNLIKAYNTYAVEKIEEGQFLESIFYLTEALKLDGHNETIVKNISIAYIKLGQQQIKEENIDDAIMSYTKAVEYDPTNKKFFGELGLVLYNWGVKFYNQREYTKAEEYLIKALTYRSDNAYVYQVLGEIAYFRQDLDNAEIYWEKALTEKMIKPPQVQMLKAKLKKLAKEKTIENRLTSYRSDKFIIRYDKEKTNATGYKINEVLRGAYRMVGRDLNYFPATKISVIIFNRNDFVNQGGAQHGEIRALYDGKIRLPVMDDDTDIKTFKSLVWHEYVHALVYELGGVQCPTWFNEGLAQHEENKVIAINTRILENAVKNNKTIPFKQFFSRRGGINDVDIYVFYQQSFSMVQYLLGRYQMYKLKSILQDIKKGKDFEKAFSDNLYLSREKFEKKWLHYIQAKIKKS